MADPSATLKDTVAIVTWQRARGRRKTELFGELFASKSGLIRQLTIKAARAEKTAEDLEDLLQAGAIGFQKAIERFDAGRGYAISTYAAWWIRHEVQRVARKGVPIALPRIRLTNEERQRTVLAIRDDPSASPESTGVGRTQFDQVKASFGLRYLSDATTRGGAAIERRLLADAEPFDAEEALDEARRIRVMRGIVFRVRAGMSAEAIGISGEVFALALDVMRTEDEEKKIMSEQETTTNGAAPAGKPKRKYTLSGKYSRKTKGDGTAPKAARRKPGRRPGIRKAADQTLRTMLVQRITTRMEHLSDLALLVLLDQIPNAA